MIENPLTTILHPLSPTPPSTGLSGGGHHHPGELLLQTKKAEHHLVHSRISTEGKSGPEKVLQIRFNGMFGAEQGPEKAYIHP